MRSLQCTVMTSGNDAHTLVGLCILSAHTPAATPQVRLGPEPVAELYVMVGDGYDEV